jgi:hypothetical protein
MQCQIRMTTINRFNKTTGQWESSIFFPRKFDDSNGCSYNYGFVNRLNTVYWKQDKLKKAWHLDGPLYEIHRAITDKFNINPVYYVCDFLDLEYKVKCVDPFIEPFITAIVQARYFSGSEKGPFVNLHFFDFQYHLGLFIPPGKLLQKLIS